MTDEEKRPPGPVRRVGPKDRKNRLDYGKRLFPPETPLPLDPPPPDEGGEPLPFDAADVEAEAADRFPPLPFDGDDLLANAQDGPADEEDRFPPLPPPGWARPEHRAPPPAERPEPQPPHPKPSPPIKPKAKRRPAAPPKRGRGCFYNLVTLLFLALTVGVVVFGVYIFNNPYSSLNPLPPPTPLPIIITATFSPPTEPAAVETDAPVIGPAATQETPAEETTPEITGPTPTFTPLPADLLTQLAPPTQESVD
ncbi:MAG: hypothetical protein DIU68_017555 [Chloroflexota bacterium]